MICLVTDRRRLSTGLDATDRLVDLVGAAARAGVDLIQIRERDLEGRELAALVTRCVAATGRSTTKVLVNDRVDLPLPPAPTACTCAATRSASPPRDCCLERTRLWADRFTPSTRRQLRRTALIT